MEEKIKAPNCYDCKWRGSLPGSAHSKCNHPTNQAIVNDPLAQAFAIFASVGRFPQLPTPRNRLGVSGNAHGVANGWFNWPLNFDPIWLESCNGFEPKGGDKNATKTEQHSCRADSQVESVSQSVLQRDERNERLNT
jgi:hypothetical protein